MCSKLGPVKTSRPHPLAAFLALVAVLFSQLAVSAYACPGADGMQQAPVAAEDAPPCHQNPTPADPTPLCQAHCQQGDTSFDPRGATVPAISLVALPASWLPVPASATTGAVTAEAQASLLERPTGPPLAVRHCCLRI
jgi:hypothetical protein